MGADYNLLFNSVEEKSRLILDAQRQIWQNPESGYKEWKTHKYLKEQFEKLGYNNIIEAGNIPGFYVDVETGKPGPKIAVFGEMDSLIIPSHPECDKQTGAVHACGHNCQTAALLGVAAALNRKGALKGLSGSVRLIAVPAEEGIELEFRDSLIEKGIIKYRSGKQEFLYRGYLDGVDIAIMVHTSSDKKIELAGSKGSNGFIAKSFVFKGKAAHAGGAPHLGINALYAANAAISAVNALRETFTENDLVRFHPIITKGGDAVNAIPDEVVIESYLRAASVSALNKYNEIINRAFAGAAASFGCELIISDRHGASPRYNDPNINAAFEFSAKMLVPEEKIKFSNYFAKGCSDLGDICTVIPCAEADCSGSSGAAHSVNFKIDDPYTACVLSAKYQVGALAQMLENNAQKAKYIIENKKIVYKSKEEFFAAVDAISADINAVTYSEDGTILLKYKTFD